MAKAKRVPKGTVVENALVRTEPEIDMPPASAPEPGVILNEPPVVQDPTQPNSSPDGKPNGQEKGDIHESTPAEIVANTARFEADNKITADILAQHDCGQAAKSATAAESGAKSEGKPNGEAKDSEGFEKGSFLSPEAHAQRKEDVKSLRLRKICNLTNVQRVFGDRANPVTLEEYSSWRDGAVEKRENAPKMFSDGAFKLIKHNPDLQKELFAVFNGREAIDEQEVLSKIAEIRLSRGSEQNMQIDGEPVDCVGCAYLFTPMKYEVFVGPPDKKESRTFGNFLAVDGIVKAYDYPCSKLIREEGRKNGKNIAFLTYADATERASRQSEAIEQAEQKESQRRERFAEHVQGVLQTTGGLLEGRRGRDDNRNRESFHKPGVFNPQLEKRHSNPFATLVGRDEGHPEGPYYSPEFPWKINGGVEVRSFLHLNVTKYTVTVVNAGPGLEGFKQKTYNLQTLPKALYSAVIKARNAQQGSGEEE